MQRAMSSLNPGTDEGLRVSSRRWNVIVSGYCPSILWLARRNEMHLLRWCLEFDIRPYDGDPKTDHDIGGSLALHKQTINTRKTDPVSRCVSNIAEILANEEPKHHEMFRSIVQRRLANSHAKRNMVCFEAKWVS